MTLLKSTGNIGGFTIGDNQLMGYINVAISWEKYNLILQSELKFDGDDVGGFLLTTSGSGDGQVVNVRLSF